MTSRRSGAAPRGAGQHRDTRPPWLDDLPEPLRGLPIEAFVERFRAESSVLLDRQCDVVADPGRLAGLEWDVEQRITEAILECFGSVTVLAEERFARCGTEIKGRDRPGGTTLRCLLDPLDGSASYARGSARFTSSFAVTADGDPVLALIYEPFTGRLYSAVAGRGCHVDGAPLPRQATPARRTAVVKAQWVERVPAMARSAQSLAERGYWLERMECTSLKLCWVAQGRRAGLLKWLSETNGIVLEWGTTGGLLMCQEAGMRPFRLDGSLWAGQGGGLVIGDETYLSDAGMR